MSELRHPFADAPLHVYQREDGEMWLAHFHPQRTYRVIFTEPTREAVVAAAETFRDEQVERNQAVYAARAAAIEKARATKAKKAAEDAA